MNVLKQTPELLRGMPVLGKVLAIDKLDRVVDEQAHDGHQEDGKVEEGVAENAREDRVQGLRVRVERDKLETSHGQLKHINGKRAKQDDKDGPRPVSRNTK